jgi:hypothetical protein
VNPETSRAGVNEQTAGLVNALHAVDKHVPTVATALLAGSLPVGKQREFAGLLIELGELLHSHADGQDAGIIPATTTPSDSDDPHSL